MRTYDMGSVPQKYFYYKQAKERYLPKDQDMEMDMLDHMMQDLKDGGWL